MPDGSRKLNLFDATMLVMGGIIGVGIFFKPYAVATHVHEPWAFFSMWALGALGALAGAMTFAELAGSFPKTGGWYVFLREGCGKFPAFLFAWIVLTAVSTGACAVVGDFFGARVAGLLGLEGESPRRWIAAGVVVVVTALAMGGIKTGALFQNLCMLAKLLAIAALVFAGLVLFGAEPSDVVFTPVQETPLLGRMLAASLPVLFTYGGWQLVTYIAPHVENPARTLPKAIVMGVAGVGLTYMLLNAAYVRVLGMGGILSVEHASMVPTLLAERTLGPMGARFMDVAMAVSALGFLAATLLTTPGIYVAMAKEGLFFEAVGRANSRTGAPVLALVIQASICLGYIAWHGDLIDVLADSVVFAEWIFHGLVGFALLRLRRTRPNLARPFRSPLYPLFPVLYVTLAVGVVVGNLWTAQWEVTRLGLIVFGAGMLVYYPWVRCFRGTPSSAASPPTG
jgi:basic amino acid/polyamine antiporter, APA family